MNEAIEILLASHKQYLDQGKLLQAYVVKYLLGKLRAAARKGGRNGPP